MESWSFPNSWKELWNSILEVQKDRILHACAARARSKNVPALISPIAEKLHTREQTVTRFSNEKVASHLRAFCDNGATDVLRPLFGLYMLEIAPGIFDLANEIVSDCDDDNGVFDPEDLEVGIADALRNHPLEDVRQLAQFLSLYDPRGWSRSSELDFNEIENMVNEDDDDLGGEEEVEGIEAIEEGEQCEILDQPESEAETTEMLAAKVDALRAALTAAAATLNQSAGLLSEGVLPERSTDINIHALRRNYVRLRALVTVRMMAMGMESIADAPATVGVLESAIDQIRKIEKRREEGRREIEAVLHTLEIVLSLSDPEGYDLPSLANCRQGAADLRAKVAQIDGPELPAEIVAEMKPYEAIIRMLHSGGDSSQDLAAVDQIAATFGAGLVWGLARGLIAATPESCQTTPEIGKHPKAAPVMTPETTSLATAQIDGEEQTVSSPAVIDRRFSKSGDSSVEIPAIEATEETEQQQADTDPAQLASEPQAPKPNVEANRELATIASALPSIIQTAAETDRTSAEKGESSTSETSERAVSTLAFKICAGETCATLASELHSRNCAPAPALVERLAWHALGEQKVGSAYQLANYLALYADPDSCGPLPVHIRAAVLGQAIRNPIGPICDQLKLDYSTLTDWHEPDSDEKALAYRLLLISSTLRPAVLAPDTNAKAIMEIGSQSLPRLERLYWLSAQIADYAVLQMPLDTAALEIIDSSVTLNERVAAFQAEVKAWWNRAPQLNFKYAPAQHVWKSWLEADSPVGQLILPILRNEREHLGPIKDLIERLSTEAKIRSEINTRHDPQRTYGFQGKINWSALSVFTRHVQDAVEFANRWVALQEIRSSDQLDYRRKKLLEMRMKLDSAQNDIRAELSHAIGAATDLRVRIALETCRRSFEGLLSLMHPTNGKSTPEPAVKYLLGSDFLLVPGLPLSNEWEPQLGPEQLLRLLIATLADSAVQNWDSALDLLSEDRRDHEAVDRIHEYLAWEGQHEPLFQKLTSQQESHLKQCQDALVRQMDDCTRKIEMGVSLGLVRDHQRAEYLDRIQQISRRLTSIRNFESEEAELRNIIAAIEDSRMRQVQQVQERVKAEGIPTNSPAFARIQAALERSDVDTANEYIDLTLRGDNLPEPQEVLDSFRTFFPKVATQIDDYLSGSQNGSALAASIEARKAIPGLDLSQIPGAQIREAAAMFDSWTALKRAKRAKVEHLNVLFEKLGFRDVELSDSSGQQRAFLAMRTAPLMHRDQCPIPYFGSVVSGNYRVICIWDRPSEEQILDIVRHGRQGAPAIVLYFGRVGEQKRRNIAQLSRADNLNFILIDELLVAYLCGVRGSRLPVLFDCALPLTFINPYTTTSSNVPPEMFYGRRWERGQIIDPMGSCFVYGGRQLGKTALLLSIRDEFHNPVEDRVAVWIDLRSYADDIWTVLSRVFKDVQDVDLQIGDARSEQKLIERLQAWLLADNRRRILLLLDEADRFLESDSEENFRRTSVLKGLMERTNRRFKVVFAGLHNVQRTTKQENHPLAHFGEPICIGPLLDNGEWKEAKALIERPFWSMGFRFESPDLVTRILSRTNYYPSLIQLYCNQIYQSVKLDHSCLRSGPPYLITSKHVEDAYSSRQFENAIREKFELTLNLDPRYRVLALIIALNSLQGDSPAMSISDIREQAFNWWKLGFTEMRTEEDFRVLLEEMLGLGILREVNGGFALRTPNLLSLLGRQDQIEQKLLQSSYDAPPPPYAAHVHRTSDRKQPWRRNPLSDQQESGLRAERNSVTVIFGTKAAGVDDIGHFLSQSSDPGGFSVCEIVSTDRHAFRTYLETIRAKRHSGTSLVIVQNSPWTTAWIEEALAIGKGRTRFTSVVFVADPAAAWGLVQDRATIESLISLRRITTISLQPWHSSVLWRWLGDCSIGSNTVDEQKEIGSRTGRWPMILDQFRSFIVSEGMNWKSALDRVTDLLESGAGRAATLDAFGLSVPVAKIVMQEVASLGGQVLMNDLFELLDTISKDQIANVFYWADHLGLIQPAPGGEWAVDPIVQKVLMCEGKADALVDSAGTA